MPDFMNPETYQLLEQWLDNMAKGEADTMSRLAIQKGSLFGLLDVLCIRNPEISAKLHGLLVSKTQTIETKTK